MKKVLPLGTPFMAPYKNQGIPFSIMANDPNSSLWILNRFIQLYTRAGVDDMHWLQFYVTRDNITDHHPCNPWLKISLIDPELIGRCMPFPEFLMQCIDSGRYVEVNIDQFYAPHALPHIHNTVHRYTNILVFGYDREEETFDIMDVAYTTSKQFAHLKMNMNDIIPLIEDLPPPTFTKSIEFLQPVSYQMDITLIVQLLEDYLSSFNTASRMRMLLQPPSNAVFGISIYNKMREYVDKLSANQLEFNINPFNILYEHKKCICGLIKVLAAQRYIRYHKYLSEDYANELEVKAQALRNLMNIRHTRLASDDMRKKVLDSLANIQALEKQLMESVLEQITDKALVS